MLSDRMHSRLPDRHRAGFSLVELSVVIVIMSIVAVMGLEMSATYINRTAFKSTAERMIIIRDALSEHVRIYGRLPCPALIGALPSNTAYGAEAATPGTCTSTNAAITGVRSGAVPVRSLGLPLRMMYDGYGDRFHYFVTATMTASGTYQASSDALQIRDGVLSAAACTTCPTAAYVVFSVGQDRRGGITKNGASYMACLSASAPVTNTRIDAANCRCTGSSCDTLGVAGIATNVFYDNGDTINTGNQITRYYDDLMVWRSKNQL